MNLSDHRNTHNTADAPAEDIQGWYDFFAACLGHLITVAGGELIFPERSAFEPNRFIKIYAEILPDGRLVLRTVDVTDEVTR